MSKVNSKKSIKAALIFYDTRFNKTHDLENLLELAIQHDKDFSKWLKNAGQLTPLAVAPRYPSPHYS